MANELPPKKGPMMATAPVRHNTAEEELLDHLGKDFDKAAEKEPHKKFMKRVRKALTTLREATAVRSRRRGTA